MLNHQINSAQSTGENGVTFECHHFLMLDKGLPILYIQNYTK